MLTGSVFIQGVKVGLCLLLGLPCTPCGAGRGIRWAKRRGRGGGLRQRPHVHLEPPHRCPPRCRAYFSESRVVVSCLLHSWLRCACSQPYQGMRLLCSPLYSAYVLEAPHEDPRHGVPITAVCLLCWAMHAVPHICWWLRAPQEYGQQRCCRSTPANQCSLLLRGKMHSEQEPCLRTAAFSPSAAALWAQVSCWPPFELTRTSSTW